MERVCKVCGLTKQAIKGVWPYKRGKPEGRACLACSSNINKERYREAHKLRMQKYASTAEGQTAVRLASKLYKASNRGKENTNKWNANNKSKLAYYSIAKRAIRLKRFVNWANPQKLHDFYEQAQRLSKATGVIHHVDHIIPLCGKLASGLHIETNLQVIPAHANLAKKNKFEV